LKNGRPAAMGLCSFLFLFLKNASQFSVACLQGSSTRGGEKPKILNKTMQPSGQKMTTKYFTY
jgi:hypothetical protein